MIARAVWIAALAVVAAITAQLQFDRQALRDPEIGQWVAAPFRGNLQVQEVLQALVGDDPAVALREARELVRRRPVPAEHLTLLAQASFKAGEVETAALAVQIAAQRGWRDPVAQEAMARLALNADDMPEATRRFVALMVLGGQNDAMLSELAEGIFADPESAGYETLIAIIAETDRWQRLFLRRGPSVMPPDAFAQVIITSSERGTRFDCAGFERAARQVARRDADAGAALSNTQGMHCR